MLDARTLTTERLRLRPLTIADVPAITTLYSDPDVARYVGGDRLTPETIRLQTASFAEEWQERGYGQSAVVDRTSGEFLGRIGLRFWPNWNEVELGYVLGRHAQGRGVAFEGASAWVEWARASPALERLIANIHPENTASIGLAQKLGFTFARHDTTPSGVPTHIYELPV
ncbi:GNAT family N-acetyltransferase [Marisediminicola sp. LYQ85]|uniref:GNAT family N-acetyltransferase n=1 Tax=Marisediminicola sp. LYQ85 TaxID=3391062 RepID=UPI003983CA10